jgi:alpha-D-xyloside xylohydrolase
MPNKYNPTKFLAFHGILIALLNLPLLFAPCLHAAAPGEGKPAKNISCEQIADGIWRIRLGKPEELTPTRFRSGEIQMQSLKKMSGPKESPIKPGDIQYQTSPRGCAVTLPMSAGEHIYGLGLSARGFDKTNTRQKLIPSDNPEVEGGPSHAPVPFYVSTDGYGVFVDTARYASFNIGNTSPLDAAAAGAAGGIALSTEDLYKARTLSKRSMLIDIPAAQGVDLYIFAGPQMADAVRRYNLFSGGGTMPPLWGLGVSYRGKSDFAAQDSLALAKSFREQGIPCDLWGLEPGWQSAAYPCSFVWDKGRFPDPVGFIKEMTDLGYRLSPWEHCFTHSSSPIYNDLKPFSGSYRVFDGLVPDFATPQARRIFVDQHEKSLFSLGVQGGMKLDECDHQPWSNNPWSFPEASQFPSGLDGEQMHSLLGVLYMQTMMEPFTRRNLRMWGLVRDSQAMAAPLPYVIYSDSYDHHSYIRTLANQGFSGLLWVPEIRDTGSLEDLYRRVETVIFSPQALIDPWYMKLPPWLQINKDKSNAGELMPEHAEATAVIKKLLELRMSLIPYFYSAFNDYRLSGTPPIRALVMDWPADPATYAVDDQFMFGPSLLVAPMIAGQGKRSVYLPAGKWIDFWTDEAFEGGRIIEVTKPFDQVPVFVKDNSLLPLAAPLQHVTKDSVFDLTVRVYGSAPAPFVLFEDDGETNDYLAGKQSRVTLSWGKDGGHVARAGGYTGSPRFKVSKWVPVQSSSAQAGGKLVNNGDFAANAVDFSVTDATGYISQCKPIEGWTANDPNRVGLQPLVNGLSNMGPKSFAGVTHYAFLHSSGNRITQPLNLSPGVRYALSFQYAARDYADDSSPAEQVLKVSVSDGSSSLVTKDLVGSRAGFATGSLAFTAPNGPATLVFENASGSGESCVSVAAVAIKPIQ